MRISYRSPKEGINEQFRMVHSRNVFENQCIGDQEGNGIRTLKIDPKRCCEDKWMQLAFR